MAEKEIILISDDTRRNIKSIYDLKKQRYSADRQSYMTQTIKVGLPKEEVGAYGRNQRK